MKLPLVHEYRAGKDVLFDDTVWHFIDNDSTKGRRVAVWVDVVRTDLNLWQRLVMRVVIFLSRYLNDEVTDTVRLVDALDYKKAGGRGGELEEPPTLNNAPRGPIEDYDRTNVIDMDAGFV